MQYKLELTSVSNVKGESTAVVLLCKNNGLTRDNNKAASVV
jgi:hypothetical protein